MDSYASSQSSQIRTFRSHIAEVAYQSLESALARQCADWREGDMRVERTTNELPVRIQVQYGDLAEMTLRLSVRHVGGNVFDVQCSTDDGGSHQSVYSLPDDAEAPDAPVPRLGRELASFVLNELERACGRRHLQGDARAEGGGAQGETLVAEERGPSRTSS